MKIRCVTAVSGRKAKIARIAGTSAVEAASETAGTRPNRCECPCRAIAWSNLKIAALAFVMFASYSFGAFWVARMSIFAGKCGLAIVLAVLCLGGRTACAQVAPVRYWIPGVPFGFSGSPTDGQSSDTYGDFPSFDADNARGGSFAYSRYDFPSGLFVGGEAGGIGLNGIGQAGAFGNFGSLSYEGVRFGYNFKGAGDLPVTVYAGFDTLKYNAGAASPFSSFNTNSGTVPGYGAHAGLEFRPASNVSLSFGVGYAQQQSGRIDSDINSPLLPGESPIFAGVRR